MSHLKDPRHIGKGINHLNHLTLSDNRTTGAVPQPCFNYKMAGGDWLQLTDESSVWGVISGSSFLNLPTAHALTSLIYKPIGVISRDRFVSPPSLPTAHALTSLIYKPIGVISRNCFVNLPPTFPRMRGYLQPRFVNPPPTMPRMRCRHLSIYP